MPKSKRDKTSKVLLPKEGAPTKEMAFELANERYPNLKVSDVQALGKGSEGSVYKIRLKGNGREDDEFIALKISVSSLTKKFSDVVREYDILNEFMSQHGKHPHIMHPIGDVIRGENDKYCAYFMPFFNHSLHSLLHPKDLNSDGETKLSFLERIHVLIALANAVRCLHRYDIIHRDIKPENIFLEFSHDDSGRRKVDVVLGDFGCAGIIGKNIDTTKAIGTPTYMAPEVRSTGVPIYSTKNDVFSFAILMWELMTNDMPFSDIEKVKMVSAFIDAGGRPPNGARDVDILLKHMKAGMGEACFSESLKFMQSCWDQDETQRPRFEVICAVLTRLEELHLRHIKTLIGQSADQNETARHRRGGSDVETLTDQEYMKYLFPLYKSEYVPPEVLFGGKPQEKHDKEWHKARPSGSPLTSPSSGTVFPLSSHREEVTEVEVDLQAP